MNQQKLLSQIYESNYERVKDVIKPLAWWDGERYNERRVIGLKFDKKNTLFFIRAKSSHEPSQSQLKLGLFNYRARLARVILARAGAEPELNHEPELFCAALIVHFDGKKT
jgi:hypothetical protein